MNEIRCPECGSLFSIDESSYASNVLNATAKLIVVYGDSLNDEVFKEKVGAVSIKAITRKAKERRAGSMGFAEAMLLEYNGRKKGGQHRLLMNKLHAKERSLFSDIDYDDEPEETDAAIEDDDVFDDEDVEEEY